MKRWLIFAAVNIAIIITISIVMNLIFAFLGIDPSYMSGGKLNYETLAIFCLVWGMGGSFISLMLSKKMVKWSMGVQIIDPNAGGEYGELVRTVHRLAKGAGLSKMPEVGIYPGQELNAFATGPSKNNSLVAVSEGLLRHMTRDEVEGVLGHEVAHIANGDMVTMTLIQGVINAFVMFFARIAAFAVDQFLRGDDEEGQGLGWFAHMGVVILFEILFGMIGMVIVAWFSRHREYRADSGGARLAGRPKMEAALQKLRAGMELNRDGDPALATLKISSKPSKFAALFSTHPPLEDRIQRLREMRA
ncbi:protease HtpX [Pseudobacteriovorax antillogorgiicola]|uniref:Protease HtpX homolog n=1 Tax=Pseudobacteriovorax antillogorgiicola TaxID=1513793 RepID=A0A1Y6B5Y2_9BACT|nr:protease HtpX [Pseudobacteriovorax antillogorgiicola]TCS59112.1 heat shock protein [Pseudobacteriovorax antillogorgiicola]SME91681.1 heat shock protein HtpX [Pseudobacteriovorax antillogorgiicola]